MSKVKRAQVKGKANKVPFKISKIDYLLPALIACIAFLLYANTIYHNSPGAIGGNYGRGLHFNAYVAITTTGISLAVYDYISR